MSAKGAPTASAAAEASTSPSASSASPASSTAKPETASSTAGAATTTTRTSSAERQPQQEPSKPAAVEPVAAPVKIKNEPSEPVDLTETEQYKTLIEHDINDLLAEKLSQLILDNKLSIDELDDDAYGSIRKFAGNVEEGLSILNDFETAEDEKLKDGRVAYLCELIKKSDERVNGETAASNASVTPNGESSSSSTQSPAKSSTQQYQNSNSQQSQLEELKRKCDEITQRTGLLI